jgi:hypothetical protein
MRRSLVRKHHNIRESRSTINRSLPASSTYGTVEVWQQGRIITTELPDKDEDRILEENIDNANLQEFLLAELLLVNEVCDALLESGDVEL